MALLLIGVIFLIGGGLRVAQLYQQWSVFRHWKDTIGTITRSELNRISPRSEPDEIAMFEPNIIYTYTVDGRHYRGEITDEDVGLVNQIRGDQLIVDFAKDNDVVVHYDPHEPWQSTLFPSPANLQRQLFYAGAGVAIGVVALTLWLV